MPYYSGDYNPYSRGGRMVGDPGFFSFLGGLAKKAIGFIPGVGPAASTAIEAVSGGSKLAKMGKAAGAIVRRHPVMTAAGAAALGGAASGAAAVGTAKLLRMHGGKTGHHRRMRVTNPKALRRAIRRTQGFAKLAMRTIHLVHPRKKARFGGFKRRTRKAA